MKLINTQLCAAALGAALFFAPVAMAATVQPLERAHAHNDYEHDRPLYDALSNGFTSVEADVWLRDGQLLVAHDSWKLDPTRTFQSLYLDPLREIVQANGGSIYGSGIKFNLLIDVKTSATATWNAIEAALADYSDVFTSFTAEGRNEGAVTAHISGNRDLNAMRNAEIRYSGYDGRSSDIFNTTSMDGNLITMVSENWNNMTRWRGVGEMSEADYQKLSAYINEAHANGQIVRFWNTPDAPGAARDKIWSELLALDVDLINTDDLAGLRDFLLANDPNEQISAVPVPAALPLLGGALALLAGAARRRRSAK